MVAGEWVKGAELTPTKAEVFGCVSVEPTNVGTHHWHPKQTERKHFWNIQIYELLSDTSKKIIARKIISEILT